MKNKLKLTIDETIDIIGSLNVPFTEKYYDNECLSDFKNGVYTMYIFVRHFSVVKGKTGKLRIETSRNVIELKGKNEKEVGKKLKALIDEYYDILPPDEKIPLDWMPEKFRNIQKAIKVFNLLDK